MPDRVPTDLDAPASPMSPVRLMDAVWAAARHVTACAPSHRFAAIEDLRLAIEVYDTHLGQMVAALAGREEP